jgi:hypothetical protein
VQKSLLTRTSIQDTHLHEPHGRNPDDQTSERRFRGVEGRVCTSDKWGFLLQTPFLQKILPEPDSNTNRSLIDFLSDIHP